MITLPAGTQIWIAAGLTDLRRGFTGLSAIVQLKWNRIHSEDMCLCSEAGEAI